MQRPLAGKGGVVLLIRKSSLPPEVVPKQKIIVPGLVIKAVAQNGDKLGSFWCVHNYGLKAEDVRSSEQEIGREISSAKQNPTKRTVILAGDWNFLAPGEKQHSLADPTIKKVQFDAITPLRPHQTTWQCILGSLTELQQNELTHFVSSSLTEARLDRVYTSSPPWWLLNDKLAGNVAKSAKESHESGLSDHAAVIISARLAPALPEERRPVPRHIAEHDKFKEYHDELFAACKAHALPAMSRLRVHKLIIREAARLTRNYCLETVGDDGYARNTTLNSVARAIIRNDGRLARRLIERSAIAA